MCAPLVITCVRHELSRRRFVGAIAAGVAAAAAPAAAQQAPVRMPKGFRQVIDLTHTSSPSLPVYPSYKPIQVRPRFAIARDGFAANEVTFDEHTGTHVDAPSHFVAGGASADRMPVDRLIAPLVVVSIAERAEKDPDALVTVDDLLQWEKRYGRIPAGAFVAMHSGWDTRVTSTDRFLNRDAKGTMHAPGFAEAAARFLVAERDICGAGVDTLSLDAGSAQKFVAHVALLGAAKYRRRAARQSRPRPSLWRHHHRRCAQTRGRDGRARPDTGACVTAKARKTTKAREPRRHEGTKTMQGTRRLDEHEDATVRRVALPTQFVLSEVASMVPACVASRPVGAHQQKNMNHSCAFAPRR